MILMDLITVLQTYAANYGNYIPVVIEDIDGWKDVSIEFSPDNQPIIILSGTTSSADMIAKGYEWICRICGHENEEIEITEEVTCKSCSVTSRVLDPQHAYG